MKQAILPALILLSIAFVSCKKQYTCSCVSSTTVEIRSDELKVKDFEEAEKECQAIDDEYRTKLAAANVHCRLK